MNLKHLSNFDLLSNTKASVLEERLHTSQVLHHLQEVEVRRLYLAEGYSSLFVFCMKELGYDEHQSQRRISAMRLLREIPQIEPKITSGELSLTALNKAKTMFNKMAKKNKSIQVLDKIEILKSLENKSIRDCERELIKFCPELLPKKLESQRLLTEDLTEVKIILNQKTLNKLSHLKNLLSHQDPSMTLATLIDKMADQMLLKVDPEKKNNTLPHAPPQVTGLREKLLLSKKTASKSRHVPAQVRRKVWLRDKACCSFINPITKKQCGSTFQLQIEHVTPFALGGNHTFDNLRLLCRAHNIHQAVETYGIKKMAPFVPSLAQET
jgi:5-methylcytosine-specific restriction endonuclease McrA